MLTEFLRGMNLEDGASPLEIMEAEDKLHLPLPPDYKQLLSFANGAAGILGSEEVHLFSLQEVSNVNSKFRKFSEGLIIFGSDSAGEAYAFDTLNKWTIVMVPFSTMARKDAMSIGANLAEFFETIRRGDRRGLI